ncbi:hypothetical protein [Candidatus Protochlamydia phocaeensis]|uniref:hypothetical protein n=1 Tax=Candidatus Protochlamydia phocaeensis TaxID=1414722 RepID=UPI0008397E0D|nr:hypothetical protein [Candidatus Protochlamydia phocaeensis]
MATTKEIKEQLKIALKEVGEIKPWYDRSFKNWIFSHPAYPVEYAGDSKDEVIEKYPTYLREFIKERLNDNLSPLTERETKGRGGKREGAGRPKGTTKEHKTRIYIPDDIAEWLKQPGAMEELRKLMRRRSVA